MPHEVTGFQAARCKPLFHHHLKTCPSIDPNMANAAPAQEHLPEGNVTDRRGATYGSKKWEALGVEAAEKLLSAVLDGLGDRSKVGRPDAQLSHTLNDETRESTVRCACQNGSGQI